MDRLDKIMVAVGVIVFCVWLLFVGILIGDKYASRAQISNYYAHVDSGIPNEKRLLIKVDGKYIIKECSEFTFENVICGKTYRFTEVNGVLFISEDVK